MKLPLSHRTGILLLRLISSTWRFKINGSIPDSPAIIAFWHGLMLPAWKYFSKRNATGVVSLSKDGELLSQLLLSWNFELIRGSSSSKAREVLENICEKAKNNFVLLTPDGPRGPVYKFKAGAVIASHRTGTPLFLCGVKISSSKKFLRSWDRFALPLPFSKIELFFSEPIIIKQNASREEIDEIIISCEKKLCELSNINNL